MIEQTSEFQQLDRAVQISVEQIFEVAQQNAPECQEKLHALFLDVINLYEGHWPNYEKCQVGYHNFNHAVDVALVSARMMAGYNKLNPKKRFGEHHFMAAIAAALFHDSGYLKDKGDKSGKGGKYTFDHVARSIDIASFYLGNVKLGKNVDKIVPQIIGVTEFSSSPDLSAIKNPKTAELAQIVGTADLIAQMADIDYLQHIYELFDEFQEAYKTLGEKELQKRNITRYQSAKQMIDKTDQFYRDFVLPRLEKLGRMDRYLVTFFGEGRNPYLENITANLSGQLMDRHVQWRRIGDILYDLGMVSDQQIKDALKRQKRMQTQTDGKKAKQGYVPFRRRFLNWVDGQKSDKSLGDILIDMKAIDPAILRKGLLAQTFPPRLLQKLTKKDLLFLLETSLVLHNMSNDPWIFEQVLSMANDFLPCQGSSILLANPDEQTMVIAVSTTLKKEFYQGRTIPLDKGLAGWVYQRGRPAFIDNVKTDKRFNTETDKRVSAEVETILAIPLHLNGNSIGVIEFFNKEDGSFTNQDVEVMSMLANILASSFNTILKLQEN